LESLNRLHKKTEETHKTINGRALLQENGREAMDTDENSEEPFRKSLLKPGRKPRLCVKPEGWTDLLKAEHFLINEKSRLEQLLSDVTKQESNLTIRIKRRQQAVANTVHRTILHH